MRPQSEALSRLAALAMSAALGTFASTTVAAQDDGLDEAQLVIDVSSAGEDLATGAQLLGDTQSGALRRGQRRRFPLNLPAGRCAVVVARGGAGVQNLDVSITRGRAVLARDTTTGRSAQARYCAGASAERLTWTLSAFRGHGLFAAAVYDVPVGAATDGAAPTGSSPLERLASLVRAQGRSAAPVTPPARESLAEGETVVRDVPLSPGRCYRVLAASGEGIVDLDLALVTPRGAALQEDGTVSAAPSLGVLRPLCPAEPGRYRLALRAASGGGDFAWRVLGAASRSGTGSPASAPARFRVGGTGSGFLPNGVRRRHGAAGEGRAAVVDLDVATLATSGAREVSFPVQAGRCYVAIAAGMPSVRDLDLALLDHFGHSRGEDTSTDAFPAVRSCATVTGTWRVRITMHVGYGRHAVQVFGGPR